VYSVNVPVPPEVARLATALAGTRRNADARTRHTLVVKRLGDGPYQPLADEVRDVLAGTEPFTARVTGIETFDDPPSGRAPVAYLTVESRGLDRIHHRLCDAFGAVPELEGEEYVPHVTITRGGDAGRLVDEQFDPIQWSVDRLALWDGRHREQVESVALPA